jgi:K+-transporting ATPase KdpF subunit
MMLGVQWQDAVGLVLAVLAVVYLVLVLIFPEHF